MAFDYTNLYPDTSSNGGYTKSWNYTTLDLVAVVTASGYFNKVASRLGIGDTIVVAVVDAFDTKLRTAVVDATNLLVTTIAGGVVTTRVFKPGLDNVDNTSDASKPVSTAQAAALALKADLANSTASCITRAAMKAIDTTIVKSANLLEAGREGVFVWKAGDFSAQVALDTLEGVYIKANAIASTAGAWVRSFAPARVPNIRAWGALLDGSTDDSAAITAALAVVGEAFIPYTPNGFVAGNITLKEAQAIRGERKTIWKTPAGASWGVRVTALMSVSPTWLNQYAVLENILFDLAASPVTTSAMLMGTSTGIVSGFQAINVDGRNCGSFYEEESHATNFVVDVNLINCVLTQTRARQINSRRSRGFFLFRGIRIDHGQNTAQVTWEGARFADFIGLEIDRFDVVGPLPVLVPTMTYQAAAVGLTLVGAAGSASVWLNRVLIDNTRGPGIVISDCHNVFSKDTCVFQNLGPALQLTNVSKSQFSNTKIVGGVGLTGAAASSSGVSMSGCSNVTFSGLEVESNTGHGVVQVSCSDCDIIGGSSNLNTGWGYIEATAATRNYRTGVRSIGNTAGSLLQIGAQSATTNWWAAGGTFDASKIGAATV